MEDSLPSPSAHDERAPWPGLQLVTQPEREPNVGTWREMEEGQVDAMPLG